jgi:exodeoxyribonuclease-3
MKKVRKSRTRQKLSFKILTFNVTSIRSAKEKKLFEYLHKNQFDIICLQETKLHENLNDQMSNFELEGYHAYFSHAKKKGYSGTAIYTKISPKSVKRIDIDDAGRLILADFGDFYLINTYVPNASTNLKKLDWKVNNWIPSFIQNIPKDRKVIICGDLNVAHEEIDIYKPEGHEKTAGFTEEERTSFTEFLKLGYVDVFRNLYHQQNGFTYYSFRFNSKAKGNGWRLDYFLVTSEQLDEFGIQDCFTEVTVNISDHVPLVLTLDPSILFSKKPTRVKGSSVLVL